MTKRMHLTGFMLYSPAPHMIMSWVYPHEKIRHNWYEMEYWSEIASTLERGKFDLFFFADAWGGGTNRHGNRYAIQWPNHDPGMLIPYLASKTKHLGFGLTMSTTFFQPYMLARQMATLDPDKIHRIDFKGKYFDVQGPLSVIPSPQGSPYLFQAGQSERGRIFALVTGTDQMRDFCDDIASRAEANGRDPREIKIIWAAQPIVADTNSEALERQQDIRERIPLEASLTLISGHMDYDVSGLDLDKPIGKLELSGLQGTLEAYQKSNPNVTLREMADSYLIGNDGGPMIGTGEQVAEYMQYLLEEGGGDGFQITRSYYAPDFFLT